MQQIESIKYSVWNRLSRASTYILDVVVLLAEPVKIRPFSTPTDIIPVKERSIRYYEEYQFYVKLGKLYTLDGKIHLKGKY